jgi:hypothetical protein
MRLLLLPLVLLFVLMLLLVLIRLVRLQLMLLLECILGIAHKFTGSEVGHALGPEVKFEGTPIKQREISLRLGGRS